MVGGVAGAAGVAGLVVAPGGGAAISLGVELLGEPLEPLDIEPLDIEPLDIEPLAPDPVLMPFASGGEPAPMLDGPEVVVAEVSAPAPPALMAARCFGEAFM